MKKLALLALPIFVVGCATECDKASDRVTAKYEECGMTVDTTGDTGAEIECTDELAAQSTCVADCVEAADCAALDGSDVDAMTAYAECLGGCV